jgi:hypothetical protein
MTNPADSRHTEIFSQINLVDFPALSENSREMKRVAGAPDAALSDLVQVIGKDYGMTIKTLREANLDFYTQSRPVVSVAAAAGRIGFDSVLERVATIPLLEDAIRLGGDEAVLPLITRSFLSAVLIRELCIRKKPGVPAEDAYVCALFHHLGQALVLLFFPDSQRKIIKLQESGVSESQAVSTIFFGLSYPQLGMEIARFWNFPAPVVRCMDPDPAPPKGPNDPDGILHNGVCFCNQLVKAISEGTQSNILFDRYGDMLSLNKEEALQFLEVSIATTKSFSVPYRQCLLKMKLGGKLRRLEMLMPGSIRPKIIRDGGAAVEGKRRVAGGDGQPQDTIGKFFQEVNRALHVSFDFRNFVMILLDALHKGIGFDRVILTSLVIEPQEMYLQGRFGGGDILPQEVQAFRHALASPDQIVNQSLTNREDMSVVVSRHSRFPREIEEIFHGRFLMILPVCLEDRPIGVLFLDRRAGRLPPNEGQLKAASAFRDLMTLGIRKDMRAFDPGLG